MTHDHDTRQAGHFKNIYSRITLKSMWLSIRADIAKSKSYFCVYHY